MRTMALRLTKYSSILYGSLIVYGSTSTHCTQLTHYAGPTYISINTLLTVYSLLRISCIFQPIATCADPTRYLHATNIHDILTATKGRFAVRSPLSLAHLQPGGREYQTLCWKIRVQRQVSCISSLSLWLNSGNPRSAQVTSSYLVREKN